MVNRRHIRVKVMQTIYAMHKNGSTDLEKEEKFLFYSIDSIQDLYLTMISTLTEICKKESDFLHKSSLKHLVTLEERKPNLKFVNNKVFQILLNSTALQTALEQRKIAPWALHDNYISLILNAIKSSSLYSKYMNTSKTSLEEDKQLIVDLFETIIAPDEKLYDFLEDDKLTWLDDIPLVNTQILKQIRAIKTADASDFMLPAVYNDADDKDFVKNIFRKTVLNEAELAKEFVDKTPNWDSERIAEIDTIILKMAICEFLKFPSIPVKVTINEYLELAKEYSTPKSSVFINGILDNLVKELETNNRIKKSGRGLL